MNAVVKETEVPSEFAIPVVLLPIGRPTRAGHVYSREAMQAAFGPDSEFAKRVQRGEVFGEICIPDTRNEKDWLTRVSSVREDKVCLKLEAVYLGDDLIGEISPAGPHAEVLRDLICQDYRSVSVAMRAFTNCKPDGTIDTINNVISFDLVR